MNNVIPADALVPLCFVHISGRTCHRSIQTSYCSSSLLDGGYLSVYSSYDVGRHSLLLSYCIKSCHGWYNRLGAEGSAIIAFNSGCSEICVVQTGVLFFSLLGSGMGN